ncbi:MAG: sensor histidine kinase [Verrucomicrobiae bacterium]|nr:sensor histidine kinase [Verrucomicrobiae bacterium]
MSDLMIQTEFAPAERVPLEIVYKQSSTLEETEIIPKILDRVLNFVLILNEHRQIIFASENFLKFTVEKDVKRIIGLRPGEALGCVHANEKPGGCGTTKFCSECGAVNSILNAINGFKNLEECRIMRLISGMPEALDLLVYSSPFEHKGEKFVILSIMDISNLKRRTTLERIFFHDVMNSASGLHALLEQMLDEAPAELQKDVEVALTAAHEIIEEISAQREIVMAENNELKVKPFPVYTHDILQLSYLQIKTHYATRGKIFKVADNSENILIATDPTILKRAVINMLKNAFEAIGAGKTVTAKSSAKDGMVIISVNNPGSMPEKVKLQIFNRSFSTKGIGRGLGTYSIKLLVEGFLQGKVWFESDEQNGTTFYISLPEKIEEQGEIDEING